MCVIFVITSQLVNSANRERHILKKLTLSLGNQAEMFFQPRSRSE